VGGRSLDLPRANLTVLEEAGVGRDQIDVSEICTSCSCDDWFSHRGQGPATGRFGAVIQLTGRDAVGAQTAGFNGGD
jgi:copper oxidase (laccase) domain-containing protein